LFGTFIAVALWNYGISRVESSLAGTLLYVQPIVAALGGVFFLGESLTWPLVVGGTVIMAGVAASQWQQAPPPLAPEVLPSPEPERIRTAVERLVASSKEAQRSK
jgi:threonine/homoserine efflux transporter RhtA